MRLLAAVVLFIGLGPVIAGGQGAAPVQTTAPRGPSSELARVLERAAAYVTRYEEAFGNVAAEEVYDQWVDPPFDSRGRRVTHQRTRADVVFVRTQAVRACPWASFRDVFEADGQPVRDRDGRLEKAFVSDGTPSAMKAAAGILAESARYNIGTAFRTVNMPTLPLMFLRADGQARFRFEAKGRRMFGGTEAVELSFRETARPTIVSSLEIGDVPARGRFWVDPAHGTVLRSETTFLIGADRARGRIAVDYGPHQPLPIYVPTEMTEMYQDLSGVPFFKGRTECRARYGNFRVFSVDVDVKARTEER